MKPSDCEAPLSISIYATTPAGGGGGSASGSPPHDVRVDAVVGRTFNQILPSSSAEIEVAVFGQSEALEVRNVRHSTVRIGTASGIPLTFRFSDLDSDGFEDVIYTVRPSDLGLEDEDGVLEVPGVAGDGQLFVGSDEFIAVAIDPDDASLSTFTVQVNATDQLLFSEFRPDGAELSYYGTRTTALVHEWVLIPKIGESRLSGNRQSTRS